MAETPEPERIRPLPPSEWTSEVVDAVNLMLPPAGSVYAARRVARGGCGGVNALALLARNPALARAFLTFNRHLLYESGLDERIRELVVLRLSWLYRSEYEWGQHVPVAESLGVAGDEIERVIVGPDASGWSPVDAAILRATDQLVADGAVDDATWEELAAEFAPETLLDFVFTVGGYATLAMVFNACGLPLDPDLEGFPRTLD